MRSLKFSCLELSVKVKHCISQNQVVKIYQSQVFGPYGLFGCHSHVLSQREDEVGDGHYGALPQDTHVSGDDSTTLAQQGGPAEFVQLMMKFFGLL